MKRLKDRESAGKELAQVLKGEKWENTTILALPRGGVPIAWEIAKQLELPWDLLLVKKIGAPHQPEFAIGAICEDDRPLWNQESVSWLNLTDNDKESLAKKTHEKILKQAEQWRGGREPQNFEGKNLIIVDDGLATGMTMHAAVDYLKRQGANKVVIAVPVAAKSSVESFKDKVDKIITLQTPEPFFAVGNWYEDFDQVTNKVVTNLLNNDIDDGETFKAVKIPAQDATLAGDLSVPSNPKGIILFAHGSGSSRKSPRNQYVAKALNGLGFSTLLFDLLTPEEAQDRSNVFDIQLLVERLQIGTEWVRNYKSLSSLPIGYFGSSTGAAAALVAASKEKDVRSVVSRGGRPDLAGKALDEVDCPTLLIVGGEDYGVIELNEEAKTHLQQGEIAIVPGAGHLFEGPGELDEVIEYAGDWFLSTLAKKGNQTKVKPHESIVDEIASKARGIDSEESLDHLLKQIAQSRVVMLGESSHGTEEFYSLRKVISKKLIEDYGFNFIAVEGDWPDCYKLNKFIQERESKSARETMGEFRRWPTWMWANEQVLDLVEWMRGRGAGFYGLDVYSLYESMDLIKSYSAKLDSQMGQRVREAYSCFDSYDRNEIAYAKSIIKWPNGCEKEVLQGLREILRIRLEETKLHEHELFDIQQNAKIVHNAEKYYKTMMYGGADSWNVRDEHMMDTLDALLNYHGEGSKAIVWAHNTHIGDYHATDMLSEGYTNLGGLARERYGIKSVSLVGFGTYEGEVLAGRAWEAEAEVMKVMPAQNGTYEDYFHKATQKLGSDQLYLMTKGQEFLKTRKGHRAIGVVYQTNFESSGRNYVPTDLANRYDAFIFVDKTTALKALPSSTEKGVLPETWPIGI